jgi:hypothetical protein
MPGADAYSALCAKAADGIRQAGAKLDLMPDAVLLRPLSFIPDRDTIEITDPVTAAYRRPRDPATDRKIRSTGNYRAGKPLEFAGSTVVVCETPRGKLEYAVPNPDVPLVIQYFALHRRKSTDP